jgi:fructokinase
MLGAIEAGGTKFICGVGTGPDDLELAEIPTTSPAATIDRAVEFFGRFRSDLQAIGIGSFGPVDLHPASWTYGYITSTPKSGWRNVDLAGTVRKHLDLPVGFDTDVNGAALAEARWGAAEGLSDFLYLTVGTGIGGGAVVHGRVVHGLLHPEMGHIRIPHDIARDPFAGCCPFHGDCLEGLASGPAVKARWGLAARDLTAGHPGLELEAHYLALGLANWVCTLSPRRIVIGGGVTEQTLLFPLMRAELLRLLNGYVQAREITDRPDQYIAPAMLGPKAGVLGALVLAEEALARAG